MLSTDKAPASMQDTFETTLENLEAEISDDMSYESSSDEMESDNDELPPAPVVTQAKKTQAKKTPAARKPAVKRAAAPKKPRIVKPRAVRRPYKSLELSRLLERQTTTNDRIAVLQKRLTTQEKLRERFAVETDIRAAQPAEPEKPAEPEAAVSEGNAEVTEGAFYPNLDDFCP